MSGYETDTPSGLLSLIIEENTNLTAKRGIRTGACGAGMHDYCPANHTPQSCACDCHDKDN